MKQKHHQCTQGFRSSYLSIISCFILFVACEEPVSSNSSPMDSLANERSDLGLRDDQAIQNTQNTQESLLWPFNAQVSITELGEHSATLSWPSVLLNDQAQADLVQYRVFDQQGRLLQQSSAQQITLSDLQSRQRYAVFIDAFMRINEYTNLYTRQSLESSFTPLDQSPPRWPESAEIQVLNSGNTAVLAWPQAQDEGGLAHYEVWQGEQRLARLEAYQLTWALPHHLITNLSVNNSSTSNSSAASLSLYAIDHASLKSEALLLSAEALQQALAQDTTGHLSAQSPVWPQQAQLVAEQLTESSLRLRWPQALRPIEAYLVYQDGQLIHELENTETTFVDIQELRPLSEAVFSVHARLSTNILSEGLSLSTTLSDLNSPTWPNTAQLTLNERGDHYVVLEWTPAQDSSGISRYHIHLDGQEHHTVNGSKLWTRMTGLSPWSEHQISLYAQDPYGRLSEQALSLTLRTADQTPPQWPPQAELLLESLSAQALRVTWPLAQDQVSVTQYEIFVNQESYAIIEANQDFTEQWQYFINNLQAWREYQVTVVAYDQAGNQSAPLLAQIRQPDPNPPQWPEPASIEMISLESQQAHFAWPMAQDEGILERYEIIVDGQVRSQIQVNTSMLTQAHISAELFELRPGYPVLLEIFALDQAGLRSSPLMLSFTPPDGASPQWSTTAELLVSPGVTQAHLSWPSATDDVGVVSYEIYQNNELVHTLSAEDNSETETQFMRDELFPEQDYTFGIVAVDASGKRSSALETTTTTGKAFDPGFKRLSKEQVLRSLADLHSQMWQEGCFHPVHGANGCSVPRDSAYFYTTFTESNWGRWLEFRRAYPNDETISPDHELRGGYQRFDQLVYPEHINAWVSGVKHIANDYETWVGADTIVRRPCEWEQQQGLTQYANQDELLRACHANWVARFAPKALRRPLSQEELEDFVGIYDEIGQEYSELGLSPHQHFAKALASSLFVINLQPEFLYHIEVGDEQGQLTAYELANRLSYHFWDTMPDDQLFTAAENGTLMTEAGFEAQVERLFNDPKSLRSIEAFYRDFFRVKNLPDINAQDGPGGWANYNYLTGPNQEEGEIPHYNNTGGANGHIQQAMSRELINLGTWFTYHEPDSYENMFRSNLHFLECSPYVWEGERCTGAGPWSIFTYKINGVCTDMADCNTRGWLDTETGWDGVSPPITLPESERAGLVTRMPMLVHDTLAARPIRRGLNIREMLLCDPVPPPENCDVVKPPSVEGRCVNQEGIEGQVCKWDADCAEDEYCAGADSPVSMTVREKVEALTEQPGTSCAGCHSTFINGFGHALNHFSSTGQYWEEEHMFTNQRNGNGDFWWFTHEPDQWRAIDASGSTLYNDQWVQLNGAHELSDFLVETGRLEWCWSREYFRYTMGRLEWDEEAESIEAMADILRQGASLAQAFKAIVYTSSFHQLYKPPQAQASPEPELP